MARGTLGRQTDNVLNGWTKTEIGRGMIFNGIQKLDIRGIKDWLDLLRTAPVASSRVSTKTP